MGTDERWPSVEALPSIPIRRGRAALPRGVDLWWTRTDAAREPWPWPRYRELMTPDELARCDRLIFERDRRLFAATRALVRTTLSRYAAVEPAAWRFDAGPHGKPHIAGPADAPPLHFNLSNTPGLVVCAVAARHEELGVDTEDVGRRFPGMGVAKKSFSQDELRALLALPDAMRPQRFFAYWTLKESYIKARGLGLAIGLKRFSFAFDPPGNARVHFDAELEDDPAHWRFELHTLGDRHLVAVGARTDGSPLKLRQRSCDALT